MFEKKRIVPKLDSETPLSPAAYIQRRSTKEKKCFATKMLIEKAKTSQCYTINFVMLDMSKAIGIGDRATLFNHEISKKSTVLKKTTDHIKKTVRSKVETWNLYTNKARAQ